MELYKQIFQNNRDWIAEKKRSNADFFKHLAEGQTPEILYIGCSDSRVTAEEITGVEPGQMFVHRNIGNLVPNTDLNSASVINYAINFLDVKHIVVCGHYNCGGVRAAMEAKDIGILNPWLRNIRDVYRLHKQTLNSLNSEGERYRKLVELNVLEQCVNVIKVAAVQRCYNAKGYPTVHGWVFDIQTGELIDLNIDFDQILSGIREIYNLGSL